MKAIDLTPDANGYEQIARTFISSVRSDTKRNRYADGGKVLSGLIETVAYLATLPDGAERIKRLSEIAGR
jgi:hypothetical protein